MGCHAWRRGSSGVLLDKTLGGADDLMPCPLGANTRRARASFRGVYLCKARLAACLQYDCSTSKSCCWAAERKMRVAVVDLWCKASAVLVLPPLMSHLTASEAGDRGQKWRSQHLKAPPNTTEDGASGDGM
jgi:hypothetical protein